MNYFAYFGEYYLKVYNEYKGTNYDAKSFFYDVMHPLIFNRASPKDYLIYIMRTPFTPSRLSNDFKKLSDEDKIKYRKDKFEERIEKIVTGEDIPDGSVYVGMNTIDMTGQTSGLIGFDFPSTATRDEIYLSWISLMFSMAFSGGVDVMFHNKDIIEHIINGWEYYREFIDSNDDYKGCQMATWNCMWLVSSYDYKERPKRAYREFLKYKDTKKMYKKDDNSKLYTLKRIPWVESCIKIARYLNRIDDMIFGYQLGQMNKTYGMFKVKFNEINKMHEAWDKLISKPEDSLENFVHTSYKAKYNISSVIEQGGIGMKTIEPVDLEKEDKNNKNTPNICLSKEVWLMAMISDQKIIEEAESLAKILSENKRKRTAIKSDLFGSKTNKSNFIGKLTELYEDSISDDLNNVVNLLYSEEMTKERYNHFISLAKFKFMYFINQ